MKKRGFILLDIIIASLILTAAVAASMYLFRIGFKELTQANTLSKISSKIPQAVSYLKTVDFNKEPKGEEDLGEVKLSWNSRLVSKSKMGAPKISLGPIQMSGNTYLPYEFYLYKVDFFLSYRNYKNPYSIDILKYKYLGPTGKELMNVPF